MRPKHLKIQGLNSFIECQEIDFEKLTERGLFGIFGPTGCGKSTILDAITLAMYGKIARGSTDFINSSSSELKVCYEFEIGSVGRRKTYCIERAIKRDKNDPKKYKTIVARMTDKTDGEENVIAEKSREVDEKIQEILGLTFDDFTRSVVLPQGKFSEFLRLPPSNRSNMLERIFGLEKYGRELMKKVQSEAKKINEQKITVDAKISEHGDIDKDVYKAQVEYVKTLQEEEKDLDTKKKELENEYEKCKNIWQLQEELKIYIDRMKDIKTRENEISNLKSLSSMAKKSAVVMPVILNEKSERKKYDEILNNINLLSNKLNIIKSSLLEIEDSYKKILERKNVELPMLIKKEEKLNQAIEIESEIKKLKCDAAKLLAESDDNRKKFVNYKSALEIQNKEVSSISSSISEVEKKKEDCEISAEFRSSVMRGSDIEEKLNEIKCGLKDVETEIKNMRENADAKISERDKILNAKNELIKKTSELEEKIKAAKESSPGDENSVLKVSRELENVKRDYEEACKIYTDSEKLKLDIDKIKAELLKTDETFSLQKADAESMKHDKEELKSKIENIKTKNMAYMLYMNLKEGEPCPVCGSTHHTTHLKPIGGDIEPLNIELNILDKKYEGVQNILVKLQGEKAALERDLSIKSKQMDEFQSILKQKDIKSLEKEVNKKQDALTMLSASISNWKINLDKFNNNLTKLSEENLKFSAAEAKNSESIKNLNEKIKELTDKKIQMEDKSTSLQTEYDALKVQLNVDNMALKLSEIKEKDIMLEGLIKKGRQLRMSLEKNQKKREEIAGCIQSLQSEITKTEEIQKLKQSQIDSLNEKLIELCGENDPEKEILNVKRDIEFIQSEEKKLKKALDDKNSEMNSVEKEKAACEHDEVNSTKALSKIHDEIERKLLNSGFKDIDEAQKYFLDEKQVLDIDDRIQKYEDYVKRTQSSIDMINEKLKGNHIEENEWDDLCTERENVQSKFNEKIKELAAAEKELTDIKKNLDEVEKLLESKKKIDHNLDIITGIEKIIKGNKFVEFIGMSQLKYVAKEATVRLEEITRGRYSLEISEDGSFVICDYNSGGIRRSTDTLSGGELFVTSLALALALSSQIQLKGKAPLEFFFLDEGFGSLDTDLLDIVMNSLESLQSQRLCVGIISHVEELKERVPVRLTLSPSCDGHGTKVLPVEYN